ncbi:hypothetical protein KQ940_07925 [Marinobacterium sp. D7]|nr:hypothetical protein [Marinobacterium ramblicola]
MAFVILAMMLGVILSLSSLSLDITSRAALRQQALVLAQSQLARVLAESELVPGRRSGQFEDERFAWELDIRLFEFPEQAQQPEISATEAYEIELSVTWEPYQQLTLNTLRLAREQ